MSAALFGTCHFCNHIAHLGDCVDCERRGERCPRMSAEAWIDRAFDKRDRGAPLRNPFVAVEKQEWAREPGMTDEELMTRWGG